MSLRVYNSLTREKEVFTPVTPGQVGIYLCGPTVYKESHIGHAVGPVIFDAIKRYLVYKGFKVTWVVNITDVEDKIMAEAARLGVPPFELAERVARKYREALAALEEALVGLPARYQQALRLVHLEGKAVAEAAERMNCTDRAVHGLCRRGLKLLGEQLESANMFLSTGRGYRERL